MSENKLINRVFYSINKFINLVICVLKIARSHYDGSYIVYLDGDFKNHHTHTKHLRVAIIIRDNVKRLRLPKSRDKKMIESHIRVATDENYINQLRDILNTITHKKKVSV